MKNLNMHRLLTRLACLFLACPMFMTSCETDSPVHIEEEAEKVPLSLSVRKPMDEIEGTRVGGPIDGTVFPVRPGEPYPLGMWICEQDNVTQNPSFTPIFTGYNNIQASLTVSSATQSSWSYMLNGGTAAVNDLWTVRGKPLDIYSYYPYKENVTDPTKVPVTLDQTDIMYTGKISLDQTATDKDKVVVALEFEHALAWIQIIITSSEYSDPVTLNSVALRDETGKNFITSGSMDITNNGIITDNLADDSNNTNEIRIDLGSENIQIPSDNERVINILIPPIVNNGQFMLKCRFNGITDIEPEFAIPTYTLNADQKTVPLKKFKAGKKYVYNLRLSKELYFAPVGIDDRWTDKEITIEM